MQRKCLNGKMSAIWFSANLCVALSNIALFRLNLKTL